MHLFFLSWLVGAQPMDNMWELWLGQVVSIAMVGKVAFPIYILLLSLQVAAENLMRCRREEPQPLLWVKLLPVCCLTAIFRHPTCCFV